MTGGKGMLRLYEAETITAGDFYMNPFGTFFATKSQQANVLAKDYTINAGFTLGISQIFESFIHLTPYQTDQERLWGAPGDSKMGLKVNIPKKGVSQFGLLSYVEFPTARKHPISYEPFSEDAVGYAIVGITSLNFRNAVSPLPLKVTFNIGYKSHNSSKKIFAGDVDQVMAGFGLKVPLKSSQLYTEVSGEIFYNNPDVQLGQNSLRWSGGYKFLAARGIIFDVAADIELGGYKPSNAEKQAIPRFYEDYADWKLILGMTYRWTLFKNWDKKTREIKEEQEKQEQETQELREQRENVIEELEEYLKKLEEEKKKTVPF
ncbi:hypothetical protein EH223_11765 [candidate division KSB1 bacterium]|nr:hypothetical protein [candidate division KSB1 bacterium]RQW02679.1 MAG: hypothetical protein EH223_11765 [candidate division KSB1 bacterium]